MLIAERMHVSDYSSTNNIINMKSRKIKRTVTTIVGRQVEFNAREIVALEMFRKDIKKVLFDDTVDYNGTPCGTRRIPVRMLIIMESLLNGIANDFRK